MRGGGGGRPVGNDARGRHPMKWHDTTSPRGGRSLPHAAIRCHLQAEPVRVKLGAEGGIVGTCAESRKAQSWVVSLLDADVETPLRAQLYPFAGHSLTPVVR